ncbi:tetratricopeptide repeat protein [bacterium]|nr:tetratricopeptide repeat protein [bacterium]
MKKIFNLVCLLLLCSNFCLANDFKTYYDNGQNYLNSSQYSSAITEFKKALRINYLDNSARIGLVNSYLARGTYYANNEQDYEKSANDFRAALFYLKYYPDDGDLSSSASAISTTVDNLEQCMSTLGQSKAPQQRYNRGVELRKNGNLAAAGYEFFAAAENGDNNIKKHSYSNIGDILSVLDNNKKAVIYYQKSVAIDPENAALRLKYARILDKLGQDDLAVQEYNAILQNGSKNPEVLYALEKIYTKKLAASPNSAELNANLGAILQKQKKYDAALTYYKAAETIDPSSVTTRLNLGTLYQQKKDYNSALSAYNSIITLYPNNLEANLYRAQTLKELGEKEEAIKAFKKVLSIDPNQQVAKVEMFELMKDNMTPEQMLKSFNNNAAVDKSSVSAMYDYAKDLHKNKKYNEAISFYKEVLKHDANNPEIYANIALVYAEMQDFENAQKYLDGAKARFPKDEFIQTTYNKVKELSFAKKYEEANKYFTNNEYQKALNLYLTIYPQQKDVLIAIAACYKGLNNIDKSIEYYKRAFEKDKNDSEIAYYIGVLYAEKENWTSAKIYLQKALAIDPKNVNADDLLATVVEQNNVLLINKVIDLYNAKNYDQALKIISQILTEDNKNAYAYYYRGLIYDAQQKSLQAIEEYKKAVEYNKDLFISNYLIATAYDSLGQYSNAYTYYKKFVSASTENDDYKKYAQTRLNDLKAFSASVR